MGGDPVVLKIDRLHPSFRKSKPYALDTAYVSPTEKLKHRDAFKTTNAITPEAIVSVHNVRDRYDRDLGDLYER